MVAVKTLPLRVCGSDRSENGGGCQLRSVASFITFSKNNDSGEVYDAAYGEVEIINMSLGGGGNNQIICDEIVNLKNAGIFVVASAGMKETRQYGSQHPVNMHFQYPQLNTMNSSTFSSFNDYVDIAAPEASF